MKGTLSIIGRKIKELRTEFGYTQQDVAEFLGVDQSLVSKYESGERAISIDALEKLGNLFGCGLINTDESAVSTIQPFKVAFRANDICSADMETISIVNKVLQNCLFMSKLIKEH